MTRKVGTNYTTIMHGPRIELGLSCNEYCVADAIYFLSRETGWCFASKEKLGRFLGITKQTVISIVHRLIAKGLVEILDSDSHHLRTTLMWQEAVVNFRQNMHGKENGRAVTPPHNHGAKNLPASGQKSIPNSNRSITTSKGGFSSSEKPLSLLREKSIELSTKEIQRPDGVTLNFLENFSDQCLKETGVRPIIKAKEYYALIDAKKYLSPSQIEEAILDWFADRTVSDKDLVQVTRAFSPRRITSWKVDNR